MAMTTRTATPDSIMAAAAPTHGLRHQGQGPRLRCGQHAQLGRGQRTPGWPRHVWGGAGCPWVGVKREGSKGDRGQDLLSLGDDRLRLVYVPFHALAARPTANGAMRRVRRPP